MAGKLVLIDGHSILTRAFYGVPELTNAEGLHTNAVYGFLNILFKIMDEEQAGYLAVAFDVKAPTFRHEMYKEYKGTRKPMPPELHEQVPVIKDVLGAMGVPVLTLPGFEADDIIGTIAGAQAARGMQVTVVSGDRDLLQLVSDSVLVRIPKTGKGRTEVYDYTPGDVEREYGVSPRAFIDVKALMGDSSDNIPGVPSIGEKTATALIAQFGSLDGVYAHLGEVTPARAQKALGENEQLAYLCRDLVTINVNSPVSFSLEDAKVGSLYTPQALGWMKRLGFKTIVARFPKDMDVGVNPDEGDVPLESRFVTLGDAAALAGAVEKAIGAGAGFDAGTGFGAAPAIGWQILTDHGVLVGLGLCFSEKDIYAAVPGAGLTQGDICDAAKGLYSCGRPQTVLDLKSMLPFLVDEDLGGGGAPAYPSVCGRRFGAKEADDGAQLKLDLALGDTHGGGDTALVGVALMDAHVAAYLLNPLRPTYGYEDIANEHLGLLFPSQVELLGKHFAVDAQAEQQTMDFVTGPTPDDLLDMGQHAAKVPSAQMQSAQAKSVQTQPVQTPAAKVPSAQAQSSPTQSAQAQAAKALCYVAYTLYRAGPVLWKKLESSGMGKLFTDIEMPLIYSLYGMERTGVQVEKKALAQYGEKLEVSIARLEKEIHGMAGETFNINSPKQLGEVLFDHMHLPSGKKTKTGYSTAADVLEKLAPDWPVVAKVLEYRTLTKLNSTYAQGLQGCIGADGRIHGTFNQTITATGRISSTEPNLQNIPVRMELGREIRKVFVARDGCVFVDADYSQIELRVLAHLSGDERLIEAYKTAQDIHALTASQVFHVPLADVTPEMRRNAKAVNFGIVYGISAHGLSEGLSISRKEALEYINQYFETYPQVKAYLDALVENAKETGCVTTLFGRVRPIPELKSSNFAQRSFGERVAMNSPIQGTAADIMKIAMIAVDRALRDGGYRSRIVLQVHDELLVEAPEEEAELVKRLLEENMRHAATLRVVLEVEAHTGKSWFAAK
ncbi:MAG: DNA polymerase I [Lachnospiraceae bacterium]|jgi:DNA polymerase-1|nr:DNA polymerase I [Lachnospiraceae bacterium]